MLLVARGDRAAAEPHWRKGFQGRSLLAKPYRGEGEPVRVLLLVSARGGNIPTALILDPCVFQVTALYAEFHDPGLPLPAHEVVVNAIGDAELCAEALAGARDLLRRTSAPVINPPDAVAVTSRTDNARRMADLTGVVTPAITAVARSALAGLPYPRLLRALGYHAGQHFVRAETADQAVALAKALPGDALLAIAPMDARGADGLARKYRVMMIDGRLYPLHMAASADWKVHYFSSAMAGRPDLRAEEAAFLADMPTALGASAMAGLRAIRDRLGLDYAGVDFGMDLKGRLLLFEANATMTITPPDADPIWDYRRAPITRALEAARTMVRARAAPLARAS